MTEDFGITRELVKHVRFAEQFRSHAYLCPAGYPTIGYGHRVKSLHVAAISRGEGEELLMKDLRRCRDTVLRNSPGMVDESERRVAALVDFVFNLGAGAYAKSTLKKRVNEKAWDKAGDEMERWVYARNPATGKKEVLRGLVIRREKMARWLREG